jgi:hypothetical protein
MPEEDMPIISAAGVNDYGKLRLLYKELPNGTGTIKELVFREATAGDIERIGNPIHPMRKELQEQTPKLRFDARMMMLMLAQLSNVPLATMRTMHPRDWNNAAKFIASFSLPDLWTISRSIVTGWRNNTALIRACFSISR